MQLRDAVAAFVAALDLQTNAVEALTATLRERRLAFVAARTADTDAALAQLDADREAVEAAAARRDQAVTALRAALRADADARVRQLIALLPSDLRPKAQRALDRTTAAARTLRVENAVGHRLLAFAQRTQDALWQDVVAAAGGSNPGYDRNARALRGAATGGWISGTA